MSRGPHAFFEDLRNGAHLFQGTADATMTHGDRGVYKGKANEELEVAVRIREL